MLVDHVIAAHAAHAEALGVHEIVVVHDRYRHPRNAGTLQQVLRQAVELPHGRVDPARRDR